MSAPKDPVPAAPPVQPPRKRSRDGCYTCRKRKKRCDETRPVCECCKRLGIVCVYPAPGTEYKNKKRKGLPDTHEQFVVVPVDHAPPPVAGSTDVAPVPMLDFHPYNFTNYVDPAVDHPIVDITDLTEDDINQLDVNSLVRIPSPFEIDADFNLESLEPSLFGGLSTKENQMLQYYEEKLSRMICVASDQDNHFVQIFLPMAHHNAAVLHSIVAWSSFHSGKADLQDTGMAALDKAVTLTKNQITNNTFDHSTIAALLLCCSAEVCKGDLRNWKKFLNMSAAIIRNYGGLSKFLNDKNLRWIATNFAYHDLVASSSHHRGPLFGRAEYEQLLQGGQGIDPLLGICREPYQMIAEVSQLANELSGNEEMTSSTLTTEANILQTAQRLEHQIRILTPNLADTMTLSDEECTLHKHLFEIYQLTALIHLKRTIFKLPSTSLEMRVWGRKLSCLLDLVLGSAVEGNLCFPLFIAGLNILPSQRHAYLSKFKEFATRNKARNLLNSISTVEECWKRDAGGEKYVDYYVVLKEKDLDICLA
ncbi:fungal-specific transcription factor domain-domain-containing protein [Yarrowia lipolytica]|uniref:Fungal-specific transcription factor domain-domain-containing protein n=1 Tax=Yarrowia lipolytica TaxID=4952 RepID=A0A371C7K8_YARLL|nr:fungal-specific transcription factor domain-domain-containing protein [Yarrowia lipolytica]